MVYDCGCVVVGRPNGFMNPTEMRFFWLPLLTMNCSGEPFTHIYEWKRCSHSNGSSRSFLWILAVATMALSSRLMIFFPFSFPLLGSDLESEHAFDSKDFSSTTSHCLAWHSLMLWVEPLWNSHHFLMSFFVFGVSFFALGHPVLDLSFYLLFGGAFPLLLILRSKVSLILFKLVLNLVSVSVCHSKQENVQEIHLILDVSM